MVRNKLLSDHTYDTLEGLGKKVAGPESATSTLEKTISVAIGVITVVAFIYFLFQMIFAGYAYMTSEGDKGKMETARKRLTEGILGLIIIVAAFGVTALLAKIMGLSNIFSLDFLFSSLKI